MLTSMCIIITHTGEKMNIYEIRRLCPFEEVDYLKLTQILRDYAQPRNKIQSLLRSKELIRVKKGIYVFGEKVALEPYSKEHLANLIFGPSAISFEYALSFYNLIPEKVEEVTSITTRRNKIYITAVGRFSYQYVNAQKYTIGITQILNHRRNILIATKEKALCDILSVKTPNLKNVSDLKTHLTENLRIEIENIHDLNPELLENISRLYKNDNVYLLESYLKGKY